MERSTGMPAGTVTFLLTDIEGSTRMWAEQPDDMAETVARHYAIIDRSIAEHDGVRPIEQGEGDSAVGVFASARDAVSAAAAAQRGLSEQLPWIRVRMAVHSGDAIVSSEDPTYSGTSIIRCARLRDCGHGGQVLVSDTTAVLVADDLHGMELLDLGIARFRGLDRAERVWQLRAPGLATSFPPLRTLVGAPHNLPASLSSLIGRDRDLAEVATLMDSNRLLTLAGAGGVGKTRLALQAATDRHEQHPGGTWWIDLSSSTTAQLVTEQIAATIGVGSPSPSTLVATLTRHLGTIGPTLVILDNAEHMVGPIAALSNDLLTSCPDLRLLVTSREPLGITGEVVWRVPSLEMPPPELDDPSKLLDFGAAQLFIERARAARPNLVLDAAAARSVASVCTRLDGIPLAIELAAARVRSIRLDRLASGLDDAFRLLTGGDRTATARQQTLLASIAWSVELLDDVDDAVLRRLAAFATEFTIEAAEAAVADDSLVDRFEVLDAVSRLVDKSLVQFDESTGRYRLLETVRQFGLDRLQHRGELGAARTGHMKWCVEWAEVDRVQRLSESADSRQAMAPDLLAALDWAMANEPDMALRIAAGLGSMISLLGPSTCHRLADWFLALDRDDVTDGLWAAAAVAIAGRALLLQRFELYELIPIAQELADDDDAYTTLYLRAIPMGLEMYAGSFDGAVEVCREAASAGVDLLWAAFCGTVGMMSALHGHLDLAREHLTVMDEVLSRLRLSSNLDTAGHGHAGALYLAMLEGRLSDARSLAITDPSPSEFAFPAVAWSAQLGLITGDATLARDAEAWFDRHEAPALHRMSVCHARCASALGTRDHDLIAERARELWAAVMATGGAINAGSLDIAVIGFLLAGRHEDVDDVVIEWAAVVEDNEGAHPMAALALHKARVLHAVHQGRDSTAIESSHQLLALAHRSGLALHTIDGLIVLAELAVRRHDDVEAARLIGAITSAQARIGYHAPLIGHLVDVGALRDRMILDQPDAYGEGTRLDLDAIVEVVRRRRGPRGRPRIGWDSLTPTERLVAELAATGATNARISEELLISVPTVKTHLTRIYTKVGVANRTELAHRWNGTLR